MKDSRLGESLWFLWDLEEPTNNSLIFYTEGHVDLEHEVVRKSLASVLQREGIALSLGQGFQMIDTAEITQGHSGTSPTGEESGWPCDANGDTLDGYQLDLVVPATWVRIYDF